MISFMVEQKTNWMEILPQFQADVDFIRRYNKQIYRNFRDKWVGVYKGRLVTGKDENELIGKMIDLKIPYQFAAIESVSRMNK